MSLLVARNLAKAYGGVKAVKDVSLSVAAGEVLAVIGPNGAGKSTLFGMIGGQIRPDAGEVTLEGRTISGLPPSRIARLGLGRTFQITGRYASLSPREAVQTALHARHSGFFNLWGKAEVLAREAADAILAEVGIAHLADRTAGDLPYGDLKRVELAIALAGDPQVLLMDEPTAGMAAGERMALMAEVAALASARGLAVLFTEHDMDVVFGHASRVQVVARGATIAEGRPELIRANPLVRSLYLGDVDA
ncbi:ABC transporter ATP-binding protein [Lacibacterium aquatile]|uniref:ABC transporter ATP-binding protein n=1 Tax=Lacibacterium aquatile TaxID=1168082 RepID=A0ABW5DUX2_9PROT